MKIINKERFYIPFSQENLILPYYNDLVCVTSKTNFFDLKNHSVKPVNIESVSISLFPAYLKPSFYNQDQLKVLILPQKKIIGYAIIIKEAYDVKLFLQTEYKKKFKDNILRFVNRFETCFTPSYNMYYGEISDEKYNFLMEKLKIMLSNRFSQKNDTADPLNHWDYYKNASFDLINSKKASLFVISVNNEPVQITLNHHFKDILFISIPSYDIDFSKFALGNIAIYKLLEWALENNYKMLDMAYGDLEYKRRWSNYIYDLEHHILHKKGSFINSFRSKIEASIIKIKNKLKDKNIDTYIKNLKAKKNAKNNTYTPVNVNISKVSEVSTNDLIIVNLDTESNSSIKKIVYDFLYATSDHINNITIYKNKALTDFYIIGAKTKQKVSF